MDRDGVEVHKLAEKERVQYPAILTDRAWSIKGVLFGFHGNFSRGTRRVVPSGQDSSILPARVANHSVRFNWFILPAHEPHNKWHTQHTLCDNLKFHGKTSL